MGIVVGLALVLTFVLGTTTALAFFVVGGRLALLGPGVLWQSWPLIYGLVAVFSAAVLAVVGLVLRNRLTAKALGAVVLGAWFGQYLVLASGVLADEFTPLNAIFYWLLATGGPIQPAAAILGGWLGLRKGQPVTQTSR